MSALAARELADMEMDEVVQVEATFARRAGTSWTVERYINAVAAVHFRYDRLRTLQARAAAS